MNSLSPEAVQIILESFRTAMWVFGGLMTGMLFLGGICVRLAANAFNKHSEQDDKWHAELKQMIRDIDDFEREVPRALVIERIENLHADIIDIRKEQDESRKRQESFTGLLKRWQGEKV